MTIIKACIFDLDGVIVDTAKYHYIAWKQLCNDEGFDFSEHDNEELKGISRVESLEILLNKGKITATPEQKNNMLQKKNNLYVSFISKMNDTELLPGVVDFLKSCRLHNIKIVLGSASKNARMILDKTNLTPYFDAIIDGNSTSKSKPNPEVFLMGARAVGEQPENCVVFEDAIAGVEAAISGGMKAIGIGEKKVLTQAHHVVTSLQEIKLIDILKNTYFN